MNRKYYRKLARQEGITVGKLKLEMQNAIDAAYINPTFMANCIPRKGEIPTVDEFIDYTSERVKLLGGRQ